MLIRESMAGIAEDPVELGDHRWLGDPVSSLVWSSPAETIYHTGTGQRERGEGSSTVGVLPGTTAKRIYIIGENE